MAPRYVSNAVCKINKNFEKFDSSLQNFRFLVDAFSWATFTQYDQLYYKILSLLNCVDSVDACVTWVTGVRMYMSDMGQKVVWIQWVFWVNKTLAWINKILP